MGLAIAMLALLVGVAATLFASRGHGVLADHVAISPSRPSSPLDEAERILAMRYARGDIRLDEYQRMLVVLRK